MLVWPWQRGSADERWQAPDWSQDIAGSLSGLHDYAERQAQREIDWYRRNIARARRNSRWLRLWAIVFTALGGLVPMLTAMALLEPLARWLNLPSGVQLDQLGYLFLAIAGSFALVDRFFGCSTAWMRYVSTMISQEKLREQYRLDWARLERQLRIESNSEHVEALIALSRDFLVQMKEHTERETQAWISEFQANLSQLERDLRAQMEASRPGAVDVRIADGNLATEPIQIAIDQLVVESVTSSSGSIGSVAPGLHKVSASTRRGSATFIASQIVTVQPAAVVRVELSLGLAAPVPGNGTHRLDPTEGVPSTNIAAAG